MTYAAATAWKPCDLRGVYPEDISEEFFRRVGAAIGSEMEPGESVVVGGDFRSSTKALKHALIDGLAEAGPRVIDCGEAPTPVVYFHAAERQAGAMCMVTASHNPVSHNGLKWMLHGRPPLPEDIARVRAAVERGPGQRARGSVETVDAAPAYARWIGARWSGLAGGIGPLVVDAGNGAWSRLAPGILRSLGFEVHDLFCEPDGTFPNRPADCARTANLAALRKSVVEHGAALGIAFDGDGDRAAFVDAHGVHASTDEISILLARGVLANRAPGEPVVCDIKLSEAVRREVLALGGVPLIERSGHAFMRHRLLTSQAVLGLDACGHYFFREAGSRDDGLYSALFLIGMLNECRQGRLALAQMRQTIGPIYSTPELRIPSAVLPYGLVVDRLRHAYPGAEELAIDGARLTTKRGIALARESSTEPVVSLRLEAFNPQDYEDLVGQCLDSLGEARELLLRQIQDSAR